ncbi:MAG TPA: polyphosphate:AMP phosphotransferase [Moraxellaceae bacterium]|nr:polyphosphate:AMP phosphotransferase [Moraxellaceae bacterium]
MFETAETGQRVSPEDYAEQEPRLRDALLAAQYRLLDHRGFPVVILVAGVDGAGKGETVNLFNEWMDPRHISTHGFGPPSQDERQHPPMRRFWDVLPPRGRMGMLFGSWYTAPIVDRALGNIPPGTFRQQIDEIVRFERMLATEGTLLLKLWFHLSKRDQRHRLNDLERDPLTRWRVSESDWNNFQRYDRFRRISAEALTATSTDSAPWHLIDGSCPRHRSLAAGGLLLEQLTRRLDATSTRVAPSPTRASRSPDKLAALDYDAHLSQPDYEQQLELWQGRLNRLIRDPRFANRSLVVVFEGQDAAGKGGAIRRLTGALDARHYQVIPVSAPSAEERDQPWLWRFWRRLPRRGHVAIFDRSWYGRVLVERVEKFCTPTDWERAYDEINDFEQQLVAHGTVVAKFFLAITKDEQLRRFRERASVSHQNYKLTPEDWRNRRQWRAYEGAINDMVARTGTDASPWTLVAANDVEHARIAVLRTLCERLQDAIDRPPRR